MTRKVFWDDPYAWRLDTRVTGVHGADVTVEETIFYAFSGGQESDEGTIGQKRVLSARTEGQEIFYTMEPDHGFRAGDRVPMVIDWDRRYRLMRLHFAAELVLVLVSRRYDAIEKIGAHISPDKARIDFRLDTSVFEALPEIQESAGSLVRANRDIVSRFSDEATGTRYWEIADFARVPCGGTHLRRTGEVGSLALKRRNVGKAKERIEISLLDDTAGRDESFTASR
ncbi:MAG: alanyl-tRNA editing protein [Chloroflexota bacterium]